MIVNDDNRLSYICSMARHYNQTIEEIKKEVEKDPDILERWAEHLENDFKDDGFYHNKRSYRNNYYE